MQTKKIVYSVIVGMALVAFAVYTVCSFVDAITTLADYEALNGKTDAWYYALVSAFELAAAILGMAYLLVVAFVKSHRGLAAIISASTVAFFMIVFIIVLKATIPMSKEVFDYDDFDNPIYYDRYEASEYVIFAAYLNTFVKQIVTLAISAVFVPLLCRKDKNSPTPAPSAVSSVSVNTATPASNSTDKHIFCSECGTKNNAAALFCNKCGRKLD